MAKQSSLPATGRLSALRLRVVDADRAARFFGALLGAKTERKRIRSHTEQWIVASSSLVEPIDAVFTDDRTAPPARLCFATEDPEAAIARTIALGGSGRDTSDARDDQGVPLAFYVPAATTEQTRSQAAAGVLGVVIVLVPDTAKARHFHSGLFGQEFHKVGSGGDFWWVSNGPSMGIFPATHDVTNPKVPRTEKGLDVHALFCVNDLERAMTAVRELGGKTLDRARMGPYHVCDCRDDQGTRFGLWWDPSK